MQEQVCKNCGNHFSGKFCNNCGEKVYTSKDKTILHFLEDGLHFITHFEGTLFTTLKEVLFKPGNLSTNFCDGIRKRYFKPLSFFLLLVVSYLIFPLYVGLNMPFSFYLFEKPYAAKMITAKTGVNMDSILHVIDQDAKTANLDRGKNVFIYKVQKAEEAFKNNKKLYALKTSYAITSEKTSKLLLFILIPVSAIALFVLFFIRRKYFFDHLIMATEICCFYIIFCFFVMPLFTRLSYWISPVWSRIYITEDSIGYSSMAVLAIFCIIAFRKFYKIHWLLALPISAVFVYALNLFVWQTYKYLLFAITLKLSH
ncbi:MAG: DUF3667 domain-containing protein [Chitinophagaceae bacterium]|nr:MAG: DUF3667 domain-containing protein [Chitinophagaceae bacterium]